MKKFFALFTVCCATVAFVGCGEPEKKVEKKVEKTDTEKKPDGTTEEKKTTTTTETTTEGDAAKTPAETPPVDETK